MPPDNSGSLNARILLRTSLLAFLCTTAALLTFPEKTEAATTLSRPANNLGLVGYWSFEDGTGTRATDFSGRGNTGTLDNPSWTSGKRGKALNFDNVDDAVTIANESNFDFDDTSAFSMSAWVYRASITDEDDIVVKIDDTNFRGYSLYFPTPGSHICNTGTCLAFYLTDGVDASIVATSTATISQTNRWYHVTATYNGNGDSSGITMYVNGVDSTTSRWNAGSLDAVLNDLPLVIGDDVTGGDHCCEFSGRIDEVRVYNRALSPSEVARLAQTRAVRVGASSAELHQGSTLANGLIGHWTFDGPDTVTTVTDRSGSNNHGYFIGDATSSAKVSGKLGQAFNFDGTDDYVSAPSALGAAQDAYTLSAWVNGDVLDTSPALYSFAVNVNDKWIGGSDDQRWWCNKDSDFGNPVGPLFSTGWHLLTCTYDGVTDKLTLYVDGVQIDQVTSAGTTDMTGNVEISTQVFPWDGKVDDARVYNRALSPAEVRQLYQLGMVIIRP